MKKIILVCALTTLYFGLFAQSGATKTKKDNGMDKKYDKDCAMTLANGKMMMIVDGKTVVMDKEMTTKNGTVVMMDGTVKMKDGKTMKMKESDCIDMSGKMIVVKNTQIKKEPQMENDNK